jgi:hypothetical protein
MRPHALAGAINRAKAVYLYVDYGADDAAYMWLEIPKARAKEIVDDARASDIDNVAARVERGEVYIGDPDDFPEEAETDAP